jgi:D-tyrosyl-tRNA(Tyr) deacylase
MRGVIQRVSMASVKCSSGHREEIKKGILIFLGIEEADQQEDIEWLSGKISRLRIFDDHAGVMNVSISDIGGEIMVISQFTLHASTKKGNRPSYIKAAPAEKSEPLYNRFIAQIEKDSKIKIKQGVFGDEMEVMLINDGPVTILIDTRNKE